MKYNFDEVIDRSGNRAAKYDERMKKFGTSEVIPLWIADMDFKTAQPIIDACAKKAAEGIWGYTSRPESYFKAYHDWQQRRNDWDIDVSLMSWCPGVVPALSAMVKVYTEKDDKVLIQTPVYSEFYDVTEAWGREVIDNRLVEGEDGWHVDFADFEAKAKQAKIFLLCSPHNPLGIVWRREELEKMLDICRKCGVLVISDEIHSDIIHHGKKHIPTATVNPNVISCISVSKTFNLAGLQAAVTVFPNRELKAKFDRFWGNLDIHRNNAFSSVAMEAAMNEGEDWLEQALAYISANFDYVVDYIGKNIPGIRTYAPDATYLMWLDCRGLGIPADELNEFMIKKAGLGLNDGLSFARGLGGFMRLNAACPRSVLEQAMKQLEKAVKAIKE